MADILFLAVKIYPRTSCGTLANKLAQALIQAGHRLTIITDEPLAGAAPTPEGFFEHELIPGAQFFHIGRKAKPVQGLYEKLNQHGLGRKLMAVQQRLTGFTYLEERHFDYWAQRIEAAMQHRRYDLVFAYGSGYDFSAHFGMQRAQQRTKTSVPWVANFHDPYPMHLYPYPYAHAPHPVYIKQQSTMKQALEGAAFVSSPSQRLNESIMKHYGVPVGKMRVLPHLYFPPTNLQGLPIDEGVQLQPDKFNIVHTGLLLGPRNPSFFLQAYERFLGENPQAARHAVLHFVGGAVPSLLPVLEEYSSKIPPQNFKVYNARVSYKKSLEIIQQAQVLLLIEAASHESYFLPGKMTEYVAADKPILALTPPTSEVSRLLGPRYAYKAATDDVEKIYEILKLLFEDYTNRQLGKLDRPDLQAHMSPTEVANIVATMLP